MNRCHFPLIIVIPDDPVAPGDFESLVIREREISLWRSGEATWEQVQKESGGEGEQVVRSGAKRAGGQERRQGSGAEVGSRGRERRSGARVGSGGREQEVGSGCHESDDEGAHEGALERSRRRLCVTKPQMLRLGKNPKASLIFGEKSSPSAPRATNRKIPMQNTHLSTGYS